MAITLLLTCRGVTGMTASAGGGGGAEGRAGIELEVGGRAGAEVAGTEEAEPSPEPEPRPKAEEGATGILTPIAKSSKDYVKLVQAVAVDNGTTSNKGRGGNLVVVKTTPPTQNPCALCPERGLVSKKTLATGRHLFSQGSQGGRTSLSITLVYKVSEVQLPS
ncbi:hypothetical protein EDB86DRAFT_2837850 [Lactarius hatsudake]|nr:hypothetical protein EDB86DRAFT_2837850 [Lactarius hatsudake]